jgi:phosphopantothenoylcysteine synthetase/decarboxylase
MTSSGSLVRVWTDVGARKPVPLLAKIVEKDGIILVIRYLSENKIDGIWRYEDETYEVEDCPESIAEYLKTDNEENIGFKIVDDGFVKMESDDDYVPDSDEEDEESDEESDEETDDETDVEDFEENEDEEQSDSEESLGE